MRRARAGSRPWFGGPPSLLFQRAISVLAEPDLQEHETCRQHQAEADQREGHHLPDGPADYRRRKGACQHEQTRGAE
jgi:hypothetical protein